MQACTFALLARLAEKFCTTAVFVLAFCLILGVTLQVGVLTRHILDDGRGFARSKVFKHGHEEATGRTSSIGQHNLCVSSLLQAPRNVHMCPCNAHVAVQCCLTGSPAFHSFACRQPQPSWCQGFAAHLEVLVLCPSETLLDRHICAVQLDSKCNILNDQMFRSNSSAEYIARASKVVTLVDLAGHERYFKTTAYGLTGHMPDYACLIVGANAGLLTAALHPIKLFRSSMSSASAPMPHCSLPK